MKQIRLSRFFHLSEFCESQYAVRHGLIIDPIPHIVEELRALCKVVLDPLRSELGPILVTSGYRPPLLNKAIGGSRNSQHILGQAADIKSYKYPPRQVFDTIRRMDLPFDQVILEFDQWTHVSYGPRKRGQVLTASYSHRNGIVYQAVY